MLNAWHLPVAPFVKQHNDKLIITLWLRGEDPPSRVTLRSEFDNEEISLAMRKQRRQPQPGVTAWRATLDIALAVSYTHLRAHETLRESRMPSSA